MATIVQSTNLIGSGTLISLINNSDTLIVLEGVTVTSDSFRAVEMSRTETNQSAIIYGTLYGASRGLNMDGAGVALHVGDTGSISGQEFGIVVDDFGAVDEALITNHGDIFGGVGIQSFAPMTIYNYGSIAGGTFGPNTSFGEAAIDINSVFDNELGSYVFNAGTLQSATFAIDFTGNQSTSTIVNTGTMIGDIITGSGIDLVLNRGFASEDVSLGSGADTFKGRGGFVEGTVFGEGGDDFLAGGSEADILDGGDDDDELYGRDGNDTLEGGAGRDDLFGNDGDDVLTGGDGVDILNGGRGDDNMNGDADNDKLFGRDGSDNLNGGTGNDFMDGGNGDDRLVGGNGDDRIEGGDGIDTAVFTGAEADYTIQVLSNGAVRVIDDRAGNQNGTDVLTNVEFLNFTDGIVDVAGL